MSARQPATAPATKRARPTRVSARLARLHRSSVWFSVVLAAFGHKFAVPSDGKSGSAPTARGHRAFGRRASGHPTGGHGAGDQLVQVRVWDRMVRFLHWVMVISVVALSVTGVYIGNPMLVGVHGVQLMNMIRAVHFCFGWILLGVVVCRIIWMFTGTRYARWSEFVPVTRERWRSLIETIRYYAYLKDHPPAVVGHNPMAALSYLGVYALFLFQVLSGFALLSYPGRSGAEWFISGWLANWWGITEVRLVHHIVMWVIAIFLVIHIYASFMFDRSEHSGEITSMFTGWKTLPASHVAASLAPQHSVFGTRPAALKRWALGKLGALGKRGKPEPDSASKELAAT
ncbi:MAG: Ni/Fe-hydrogenase, b-type cytochrome subunit [Actinomycetia bacterium]|nr:Ni/Fe-hydrogenase, b-type cytochrome subunit [Actinomycetes bacterium]